MSGKGQAAAKGATTSKTTAATTAATAKSKATKAAVGETVIKKTAKPGSPALNNAAAAPQPLPTGSSLSGKQPSAAAVDAAINDKKLNTDIILLQQQYAALQQQLQHEQQTNNDVVFSIQTLKHRYESHKLIEQQLQLQLIDLSVQKQQTIDTCQYEANIYKTKLNHIYSENNHHRVDAVITQTAENNSLLHQHRSQLTDKQTDAAMLQQQQHQEQHTYITLKHNIHQHQEHDVQTQRQRYEQQYLQLYTHYDYDCKNIRDVHEAAHKVLIDEFEVAKHLELDVLLKKHKLNYQEIQVYYNAITLSNLESIKQLQSDVEIWRKQEKQINKQVSEVKQQYQHIYLPLHNNQQIIESLQSQYVIYQHEQHVFAVVEEQLASLTTTNTQLLWQHEVLIQKHAALLAQYKSLQSQHTASVYSVKQKQQFSYSLLQKKVSALTVDVEKSDAAMCELIMANTETTTNSSSLKQSYDSVLLKKQQQINVLQSELEYYQRLYASTVEKHKRIARQNNIPINLIA